MTFAEILEAYPDLQEDDISEALLYADTTSITCAG
jgi:uncharacterized protein (DUF433 family)